MVNVRWLKLFRDLYQQKSRSIMVLVAMVIGIFSFTLVANAYIILNRELDKNYLNTSPASATIITNKLNDTQVSQVANLSGVAQVESRPTIMGRIETDLNQYVPILLFIVEDFQTLKMDTFTPEDGQYPPSIGDIMIERVALDIASTSIGEKVNVNVPDGQGQILKVAGTVHAPGLAPAWMEGFAYGFISEETYDLFGAPQVTSTLKLSLKNQSLSKEEIQELVYNYRSELVAYGIDVIQIHVPEPNQHPHQSQMLLLLYLMEIFGIVAVVLSGVLIANMVSAILEQQSRQIGIMKATGASTWVIMAYYMTMILSFALTSMMIALPIGLYVGRQYARFASGMLNFNIFDQSIPMPLMFIQLAFSLLIPLIITAYPIYKSSQQSVKETLRDYGIKSKVSQSSITIKWLPTPIVMAVKNTFRKRTRLIYTVLIIIIGGTGFITALNVYASMTNTVEKRMDATNFNLQIKTVHPIEESLADQLIDGISGINKKENWSGGKTQIVYEDGTRSNAFSLMAPPVDTQAIDQPIMYEGTWLRDASAKQIVINQRVQADNPGIHVGDTISLYLNGQASDWLVVGVLEELIGPPYAYVNQLPYQEIMNNSGLISTLNVFVESDQVDEVSKQIEVNFRNADIQISESLKLIDFQKAVEDHLLIIALLLIFMSSLVLLVGGIGMAITMSMNMVEKTKQIGVIKSIGGSKYWVYAIVLSEGAVIASISFVTAIILSYPLSQYISYKFGLIFFEAPLRFVTSPLSYIIWLLVIVVFTLIACIIPANTAVKMSVQDTLSYE